MANIRSAEKQRRQAEKRNARNRAGKSRLRGALKKARTAASGSEAAPQELSTGFSEIDKAAKSGVIKKNTASRYKARLAAAAKRTSGEKK
jgi:small subunit ribosomal protein S20